MELDSVDHRLSKKTSHKDSLLAQKQKLLDLINMYDKKIEAARQNRLKPVYEDDVSSDSDTGLPIPQNTGPSIRQLSERTSQLSICLLATQELSQLEVLQSELNIVDPPQLQYGEPPSEPGLWQEVTAECRVHRVPFCITFHVHKPRRDIFSRSYHNLSVTLLKAAHEKELCKSVLVDATTPSDAVQIIRSYAEKNQSRRATLASLTQEYDGLTLEALPEGGYLLKCTNLLNLSWTLENKWSPIAPFKHQLKFDLQYMDKHYIKIVRSIHKQLADPSLETDERTNLLSRMLDVVLEASGAMSNIESDTDSIYKTRTTLDQEPEMPEIRQKADKTQPVAPRRKIAPKNKGSEAMAPPKQLPKKAKGKENVANAQPAKKTLDVVDKRNGIKRPLESNKDPVKNGGNGNGDAASKKSKPNELDGNTNKANVDKAKESSQKQDEIASNKNHKQSKANTDETDKTQKVNKVAAKNKVTKIPTNTHKNIEGKEKLNNKQTKPVSNVEQKTKTVKPDKPAEKVNRETTKEKTKNVANTENKTAKPDRAKETPVENSISGNVTSLIPAAKVTDKADVMLSKTMPNKPKTTAATEKNTKVTKQKSNENLQTKVNSTENTAKPTKKDDDVAAKLTKPQQKVTDPKIPKVVTKIPQKPVQIATVTKAPATKTMENRKPSTVVQTTKNTLTKPKMGQNVVSKIPQKITTISAKNQKKSENPLSRISPSN